ncbi:unnamed protein product [Cylindrotheca closterium]|uniref:Arf-GAP domain-containing protein n=1 Tax=Cylindrotheca closterium TaxID=2856 RepID=A0AAD2CR24_9STRA|nr:unnamed protein product [Cylindrotheca closterium]
MLAPPGSGGTRKAYGGNRRKTQALSPDELLRQIGRNPPNKRCADCDAKLPQCVNLTHLTFICMSCAGVHRELNSRIKGLGHSSFTEEEAQKMKETDNDKVNRIWLARYDPARDRMKAPRGNQDQQHLRAWIRKKYLSKAWYGGSGGGGGAPPQRGPPQATVAQMPPANQAATPDLLGGFGAPAPAPAPQQPANNSWDAFGGSNQQHQQPPQQQNNFANFGGSPAKAPPNDPFASGPPVQPPNNGGWDAFGGSNQQQQQQTPQQQGNFANFNSPSNAANQPPNDPFATAPAPPQQQQQNFANFGGGQPQPAAQAPPQQNFGQPQQLPPQQQQFGNFGGQQQPPQPQQMQQQPPQPQQVQQQPPPQQQFGNFGGQSPQQQQQFGNFGGQQQPPPQQQMQQPSVGQQQPNPQMVQQQAPNQIPTNMTMGQPQQQALPQNPNQFGGMNPQQLNQPGAQMTGGMPQMQATAPQTIANPTMQQPPAPQGSMMGAPSGDRMDAFNSLSIGGGGGGDAQSTISELSGAAKSQAVGNDSDDKDKKYETGQVLCYKSNGTFSLARIEKVHLDDELKPYYTIVRDFGKEKQTDNAHLQEISAGFENVLQSILQLSEEDMAKTVQFLSTMQSVQSKAPAPAGQSQPLSAPTNGPAPNMGQAPSPMMPTGQPQMGQQQAMPNISMHTAPAHNMATQAMPSIQQQNPQQPSLSGIPSPQPKQQSLGGVPSPQPKQPGLGGIPSPQPQQMGNQAVAPSPSPQQLANQIPGPPLGNQAGMGTPNRPRLPPNQMGQTGQPGMPGQNMPQQNGGQMGLAPQMTMGQPQQQMQQPQMQQQMPNQQMRQQMPNQQLGQQQMMPNQQMQQPQMQQPQMGQQQMRPNQQMGQQQMMPNQQMQQPQMGQQQMMPNQQMAPNAQRAPQMQAGAQGGQPQQGNPFDLY